MPQIAFLCFHIVMRGGKKYALFFTARFWIQVCVAMGTKMIVRLMHKFEEILVVQPGLSLCRTKASSSCRLSVSTFRQLITFLTATCKMEQYVVPGNQLLSRRSLQAKDVM